MISIYDFPKEKKSTVPLCTVRQNPLKTQTISSGIFNLKMLKYSEITKWPT